jgi:hypothetical protein
LKIGFGKKAEYDGAKGTTPYSAAIYGVAEQWADLMETMLDPRNLESEMVAVAKATYRKADTEGLTGIMYSLVVEILCRYWIYGKALNQALAWTTMNKVEDIDYKARLQRMEIKSFTLHDRELWNYPCRDCMCIASSITFFTYFQVPAIWVVKFRGSQKLTSLMVQV